MKPEIVWLSPYDRNTYSKAKEFTYCEAYIRLEDIKSMIQERIKDNNSDKFYNIEVVTELSALLSDLTNISEGEK